MTGPALLARLRAFLRDPWPGAARAGVLFLLGCVFAFGTDAGVIWDEAFQLNYGNHVLAWFESGFRDRSALNYINLFLYGGLFDAPAQWLTRYSPLGPYETRHVLTALCALAGVIATYRLAARFGGPRAGFLAGAMLALTPVWTGHGLFNPKDIPFGAAATFALDASAGIALGPAPLAWGAAALAGLTTGLALGVRSGGMFLFAYVATAALGSAALELRARVARRDPLSFPRFCIALALRLAFAAALAWALMIAAWPWAQLAPFSRPFLAFKEAAHFDWQAHMLFDGRIVSSKQLPSSYLPLWMLVTLPETYLLGLGCGLLVLAQRLRAGAVSARRLLGLALVLAGVVVPIAGVLVKRPVLYDAYRHFLFVLPPACALAGIAFSSFLDVTRDRRVRLAGIFVLSLSAGVTLFDMVRLHPYEYAFFNRSFGGLPAAVDRFELDYWGASYKEGTAWLLTHVKPIGGPLRVACCSQPIQVGYYIARTKDAGKAFEIVDQNTTPDVLLATTRYNCHRTPGEVLYRVERQGVPLLYVISLKPEPAAKRRH